MRLRSASITIAAIVTFGLTLGLAACGEKEEPPTATETPVETEAPATEVIEVAPFTDDGELADGWTADAATLEGDYAIPADTCRPSEHGAGANTVACGSTADALSACWLTEQSDQIACLDEVESEAQNVRLIQLDTAAPGSTEAAEEPDPLWLELEDGSTFLAVNGGAFSPPEGYLVGYTRIDGDGERFEELLVPADDSAPMIDRSTDMWTVIRGADGKGTDTIEPQQVARAWVLAGRTLPEPAAEDPAAAPTPESFNGRWCEAPQSMEGRTGCVTIAYPNYTIESSGQTWPFAGLTEQEDTVTLITTDAPFGTYYPAGMNIPAETLMGVADSPEEDRLWSSQSGLMLFRE